MRVSKLRTLSIVHILAILIIFGCEDFNQKVEKKFISFIETIDPQTDPQLSKLLGDLFNNNQNPAGRSLSTNFGEINLSEALKLNDTINNRTRYTLTLKQDYDSLIFENLIISVRENGVFQYILQYKPDTTWLLQNTNKLDLRTYTGIIRQYDIHRNFVIEVRLEQGVKVESNASGGRVKEICCTWDVWTSELTGYSYLLIDCEDGSSYTLDMMRVANCGGGSGDSGGTSGGGGEGGGYNGGDGGGYTDGGTGGGGYNSGGGGTSSGGYVGDPIGILVPADYEEEIILLEKPTNAVNARKENFKTYLNTAQLTWLNNNPEIATSIYSYLESQVEYLTATEYSLTAIEFIADLVDLAVKQNNSELSGRVINIALITQSNGYFSNKSLNDDFLNLIDPYIDLDLTNQETHDPLVTYLIVKFQILKELNPEWSDTKIFWETVKDVVHVSLDVFGLVPVIGEAADLVNGVIYTIEGDALNASFSFAATLPIVGVGSTATKYGLKVINAVSEINSKVKLVWKVTAEGVTFGSRKQLRSVLGLATGDPRQAHHIIPWEFSSSPVVQKAANSGSSFHMNEFMNGIPLPTINHLTGHQTYSNKIQEIFNNLSASNPNMSPGEAYEHIQAITNQIKGHINNNPSFNLGQIANLISYP